MKCPKCHFENPSDTRFCGNCGTQIRLTKEAPVSQTETLQEPVKELTRGSVFDKRYEIIEELGRGGMGKVYRVIDKKIEEEVAIKLLKPEIASDEKTIVRFRNELKFARKIIHKNVCRMYDLSEEGETQYITMEYVRGEDLKTLIRRIGEFTPGKAIFITKQVCEGLAEAHKLSLVHRDLKPQNIMIDREGNAHIMDFGIARSVDTAGITGSGVIIGTPHYMSPEQVEGKEVDHRSDIYSLGVILYEMLTGRVPFEGDTPLVIAVKHKSESPPDPRKLNPQIPEEISRMILKCMEKNKNRRYQKVEELLDELTKIKKDMPTTDRILPDIKFEVGKPRKSAVLIIFIIAAVLAVAGYFFYDQVLKTEKKGREERAPAVVEQPAQKTAPLAPQPGQIKISSVPEGAEVYLDDKREGVTPFERELSPGTYRIRITKSPGYEEKTDVLIVAAGETVSENYTLARHVSLPQPGHIDINSTPKGAEIYLNNKREGVTPFKGEVTPGTYKIRITKSPEYKEMTDELKVTAGKTSSKNYTLAPVYILNINTTPGGADIEINGNYKGKTPITVELAKNTCQLTIEKGEEWSKINESLALKPGLNPLQRSLRKVGYSLTIKTNPPGASVFIGNNSIGMSPAKASDLFGTYDIKIVKAGYKTIEESILVKYDSDKVYDLIKLKLGLGKVSIKVYPYADVLIDGKSIGEVPPIKTQEIEEGKHKIEFISTSLNKKFSVEVEIKAGESQEIQMNMETGKSKIVKIDLEQR